MKIFVKRRGCKYVNMNDEKKKNIVVSKIRREIFIDGSNLYGGLTELLKPGEYFDFASFLKIIETDFPVSKVYFYGTYMRIDKTRMGKKYRLSVRAQKAFFDNAKRHPKTIFFKGHFSGLTALGSRFPYGSSFFANKCFVYDWDNIFVKKLSQYRHKPRNLTVRQIKNEVRILRVLNAKI